MKTILAGFLNLFLYLFCLQKFGGVGEKGSWSLPDTFINYPHLCSKQSYLWALSFCTTIHNVNVLYLLYNYNYVRLCPF